MKSLINSMHSWLCSKCTSTLLSLNHSSPGDWIWDERNCGSNSIIWYLLKRWLFKTIQKLKMADLVIQVLPHDNARHFVENGCSSTHLTRTEKYYESTHHPIHFVQFFLKMLSKCLCQVKIKTSKLRQERGGASLSFFQRSWSKPFPHVLSGHHPEPSGCTLGTLPGFLALLQNLYSQNQWIYDMNWWCVTSPDWGSTKTLPIGSPPSDKPCLACSIASESQVLFTQLILSM